MSGFLLSPAASTDLDEIWAYTAGLIDAIRVLHQRMDIPERLA